MTQSTSSVSNIGKATNAVDRSLGERWEDNFIQLAKPYGWEGWRFAKIKGVTFLFEGYTFVSPDVWILRRGDKQYACEIKHKSPARNGCYGLEVYRYSSLIDMGRIYHNEFGKVTPLYVIHNHELNGGRYGTENLIEHWCAGDLMTIPHTMSTSETYYGGKVITTQINYFHCSKFLPLLSFIK